MGRGGPRRAILDAVENVLLSESTSIALAAEDSTQTVATTVSCGSQKAATYSTEMLVVLYKMGCCDPGKKCALLAFERAQT